MQNMTNVIKVFDNVTILAAGTALSTVPIDLTLSGGKFSLQLVVTGDGTLKAEKQLSNNGTDYLVPEAATDILAAITKISGPGTDGKAIKGFTTDPANFLKLKLTETGGVNPITVTGWLAVQ